ncbi:DNA polymerase III subunit beta [uncultured Ferrovibrio sp.]|jgi:DNA polymerase III, beta subunit|uniref:DNA polymerase III subunit beta n=1 Tax=uncultured Ferrovibrio sp. TaxID=1576913 RepID=UPI002615FADD|nr:DNA polymerase III subunit beta [uncultured Ferrovibrio sp.]
MKLTIERAVLLTALSHVQSVVERRNTIPILSNVLLEAEGERLALTATDLDIAVVEKLPAKVEKPGATTVAAHTFYDIVRKLPDGAEIELTFAASDQRLDLRAGRSSFKLSCLPKEDFPVMAAGDLPHSFQLPADQLRRLIDKTRFAISTEETRYYLNGIYLHAASSAGVPMLRAVATDGHRLARVEAPLPAGAAGMPGVIVPRKTVNELRKLLEGGAADVKIELSDTKIRFTFGELVLVSKLIDGAFPEYERVIPRDNDKVMEVDSKAFAAAVDRVATISTEKSRAVKLSLKPEGIELSATSPDHGSASEQLTAAYSAAPIEVGYNSRYLLDIASQIEGENARFLLADALAPTLVRDPSDDGALYVLMPMRV